MPFKLNDVAQRLIAMETHALERWGQGDPSGFLEISAPEVVYFDPFQEKRVDGLEELTRLYESLRGTIHLDGFRLLNPKVDACGEMAVLTFNYFSRSGEKTDRWNCTEVYRHISGNWKIIQTHWSITQPFKEQL